MPTFNSCLLCSPSRTTILNYAETSHLVWIKKTSTSAKVYQKLLFQEPAYLEASQFVNIYRNSYTTDFHVQRCFVLSPGNYGTLRRVTLTSIENWRISWIFHKCSTSSFPVLVSETSSTQTGLALGMLL